MSQVEVDSGASPEKAEPMAVTRHTAWRPLSELVGSLPEITLYAGFTTAIGLIVLVLALLASGILGV